MATILEWQSHITDSTDRDSILVNIDALEHLANGIMGDTSLSASFATLREGVKAGTIAPDQWTQDNSFKAIATKLTNHSTTLSQEISGAKTGLEKKLDASDFNSFKAGDFKTASDRLTSAESSIKSHTTALGNKLDASTFDSFKTGDFKTASDRLTSAESSIKSHTTALGNKLDASTFDSFKTGDFKTASDRLTSAESSIKSHTTALGNKLDASTFNSFKNQVGTIPSGKTLTEQIRELPTSSKVSQMLDDRDRNTYTVKVFIDGQIRNGKMDVGNPKDPTTQQPAVLHSAMASNLLMGQAAADFYNSLKWTVNKGRTTDPKERTVTGSRCYVLAKDIVTPSDGSVPYYDIQLERLT